ncbi:MAG: hypothetical protein ACI4DS_07875 [Eubacterium sp.]
MIKKIIKTLLTSVAILTLFAVPVIASTVNFEFNVEIADDTSSVQYSDNARKEDDNNYAYICYDSSNITADDDFGFWVVGQQGDTTQFSEFVQATARTGTYNPRYTRTYYNGNNYRLAGETYAYYVHVAGYWYP